MHCILYEKQVHIVCFVKSRHVADVHKCDMPKVDRILGLPQIILGKPRTKD